MKIGLFDSGVGGISVLKKLIRSFPFLDYLYFGDIANSPYGIKNDEKLSVLVSNILNFLESKGVDLIVAACNTADSIAKRCLEKSSNTPYISIVENAGRLVATNKVGVVATKSTIESGIYDRVLDGLVVYKKPIQPLVSAIEEKFDDKRKLKNIIKENLRDIHEYNVKELILGCTHFPLVYELFKEILPEIKIIDPADGIVESIGKMLGENGKNKSVKTKVEFYTSGDPEKFKSRIVNFMDLKNLEFSISKVKFGGVKSETNIHNFWSIWCGKE